MEPDIDGIAAGCGFVLIAFLGLVALFAVLVIVSVFR